MSTKIDVLAVVCDTKIDVLGAADMIPLSDPWWNQATPLISFTTIDEYIADRERVRRRDAKDDIDCCDADSVRSEYGGPFGNDVVITYETCDDDVYEVREREHQQRLTVFARYNNLRRDRSVVAIFCPLIDEMVAEAHARRAAARIESRASENLATVALLKSVHQMMLLYQELSDTATQTAARLHNVEQAHAKLQAISHELIMQNLRVWLPGFSADQ